MKRAISVSLGSSKRDKSVTINLGGQEILVERIGTDGDIVKARQLYLDLDGKIDAFGVGGVDLYLRLDNREYPLRAALKLVEGVTQTPLCDGRGLKHTLERRVFELAKPQLGDVHFKQAFVPVAVDRLGLAQAVAEVSEKVVFGDLMVALGVPIPVYGISAFKRLARVMLPFVSWFPMSYALLWQRRRGARAEICQIFRRLRPDCRRLPVHAQVHARAYGWQDGGDQYHHGRKYRIVQSTWGEDGNYNHAALRGSLVWNEHDGSRTDSLCREGEKVER